MSYPKQRKKQKKMKNYQNIIRLFIDLGMIEEAIELELLFRELLRVDCVWIRDTQYGPS